MTLMMVEKIADELKNKLEGGGGGVMWRKRAMLIGWRALARSAVRKLEPS